MWNGSVTPRVAILNYGCGNLGSVVNAVRKVGGGEAYLAQPHGLGIHQATHIIMPGQGAFIELSSEWTDELNRARERGVPILGICLGMQLMCEGSEEAPGVKGLGWFNGTCERMPLRRLPHIGWNTVGLGPDYYFCHSYALRQFDGRAKVTEVEGFRFAAEIQEGKLCAVQFHPEKSGKAGLAFLREFLRL